MARAAIAEKPAEEPLPEEVPNLVEAPAGMAHETDLIAASLQIFNEDWGALTLQQKIARITGHVGTIPKRGYNAFHKYSYVTEGDLVGAVRQYLSAAGIAIIPDVEKVRMRREDSENPITEVQIRYTVSDGRESFSFRMPGHGADKGDKGVYKAITGSQKYALMKLFKIETGDDPEQDTRVDERTAQGNRQASTPRVSTGTRGSVTRGGHSTKASPVQLRKISEGSRELGMDRQQVVDMISTIIGIEIVLPDDEGKQAETILATLREIETDDAVKLIQELDQLHAAIDVDARTADSGNPYG